MTQDAASFSEEARYRLLVEAITDYAIYMLDTGGHVASWNRGAQRLKGYTEGEILGQHFSRFYTEEDRLVGLPARALRTAATEGRFQNEGWRLRKDGSRFWALVVIDPIFAPTGELLGYAKVTRDLTERKAADDRLRRSEELFRRLVQGVTDYAIYMLDPDGRVANWNPGAERIKGFRADEIIGQHFSRFYTDEDRANGEPEKALATAKRNGRFERESWRVRKDGTRFFASVVIDAIHDDNGNLLGFAKITRDITERMLAARQLEQAREQLFQAQKMEAVGQLTGGVAHDFNNLLMAVIGSMELLRKRMPDDPKLTRLVDNALEGAERGATLTRRMLAFARRQELDTGPVALNRLVSGMMGLLTHSLGPTIHIDAQFPPNLPPVRADANQLETALLNLAVNARDAMPDGGTLRFIADEQETTSLAGGLAPGRYVRLAVADTGEGMDEETLKRAAEPFFTTKGVGKGTGLGLSMVHGLAEQSGGRLVLKSTPGTGTTAEIWLPVAEEQAPVVLAAPAVVQAAPVARGPLTILAVDDDPLVLMNTTAMLEDLGHTVIEAFSGKEALASMRDRAIDLLITDQAMPQMTGSQLAATVRAERPGLPVILATGYAELPPGAIQDLPRLSKPFSQADLARAVEAARPQA